MITVEVPCYCSSGRQGLGRPGCEKCGGSGKVTKIGCLHCAGTGRESGLEGIGKACVDCRGFKFRDIDQPQRREQTEDSW